MKACFRNDSKLCVPKASLAISMNLVSTSKGMDDVLCVFPTESADEAGYCPGSSHRLKERRFR